MEPSSYDDSSGTDDDLPQSHHHHHHHHQNRGGAGGGDPIDMEAQIHQLEQEAYTSVLRAFKAQADAITWEKESLITQLRKELRLSNEEHRQLLATVNADNLIKTIRDWRQSGVHDPPPPTVSAASRKKQNSQSYCGGGTPSLAKPPPSTVPKAKKHKPGPSSGVNRVVSTNAPSYYTSLIGKRVRTRWPDDNNFYQAVITNYNPAQGRHLLVYDRDTTNETWEWVNISEISPEDIQWEGDDPGINTSSARDGLLGRRKGPPQNGVADDIQILRTDTLIKEVERVFGANHPDLHEIEKAKKVLKDHEQSLIDAIARLGGG